MYVNDVNAPDLRKISVVPDNHISYLASNKVLPCIMSTRTPHTLYKLPKCIIVQAIDEKVFDYIE